MSGGSDDAVVRVGESVRRPSRPWSLAVNDLLRHLQAAGFAFAPRVLGADAQGNEVLSYLPGATCTQRPWPPEVWAEATLVQVGALLRAYHDAVAKYPPAPESVWRYARGGCASGQIVCHGDLGPANVVFDHGRITGFIDFEDAQPALPQHDLAHVAWWWVPLTTPEITARLGGPAQVHQIHRLRILCQAYGWTDPAALMPAVRDCVAQALCRTRDQAAAGDPAHLRLQARGYPDELEATLNYLNTRF